MESINFKLKTEQAENLALLFTDMQDAVMSDAPAKSIPILTKALKAYAVQNPKDAPEAISALGFVSQLLFQLQHHFDTINENAWTFNKLTGFEMANVPDDLRRALNKSAGNTPPDPIQ